MHVGEERFHVIRMSAVEFERVNNDLACLLEDHGVEIERYPTLERFFNALGYCAGDRESEVTEEAELAVEPATREE